MPPYPNSLTPPIALVLYVLASAIVVPLAIRKNKRVMSLDPNSPSFKWGYCFAYYLICMPLINAITVMSSITVSTELLVVVFFIGAMGWAASYFVATRRSCVAYWIGTFITFDLLFWLIGIFFGIGYHKSVWRKMPPRLQKVVAPSELNVLERNVYCVNCGQELVVSSDLFNQAVSCPKCNAVFTLPENSSTRRL